MAIVIRGRTVCGLCGKVIGNDDSIVMFSHFVANDLDPLVKFSDAAFHQECFSKNPLASRAQAVWEACKAVERTCRQCGEGLNNPDDYFGFAYMSDDPASPAFKLNLLQFHESCLRSWPGRREALDILTELRRSGTWKGRAIDYMAEVLRRAVDGPSP